MCVQTWLIVCIWVRDKGRRRKHTVGSSFILGFWKLQLIFFFVVVLWNSLKSILHSSCRLFLPLLLLRFHWHIKIIRSAIQSGAAGLFSFRTCVNTTCCSKEKLSGRPRQEVPPPATKVFCFFFGGVGGVKFPCQLWVWQQNTSDARCRLMMMAAAAVVVATSRPSGEHMSRCSGGQSELRQEQTGKPRISASVPSLAVFSAGDVAMEDLWIRCKSASFTSWCDQRPPTPRLYHGWKVEGLTRPQFEQGVKISFSCRRLKTEGWTCWEIWRLFFKLIRWSGRTLDENCVFRPVKVHHQAF